MNMSENIIDRKDNMIWINWILAYLPTPYGNRADLYQLKKSLLAASSSCSTSMVMAAEEVGQDKDQRK